MFIPESINDVPFQKIVTSWMASEAYRRLRSEVVEAESGQPAREE
jgi:hypothetical protein